MKKSDLKIEWAEITNNSYDGSKINYMEFEDSWLGLVRKYPLTPDECLPMPKSSEDQKPTNNC